jgi:hypothetical protein
VFTWGCSTKGVRLGFVRSGASARVGSTGMCSPREDVRSGGCSPDGVGQGVFARGVVQLRGRSRGVVRLQLFTWGWSDDGVFACDWFAPEGFSLRACSPGGDRLGGFHLRVCGPPLRGVCLRLFVRLRIFASRCSPDCLRLKVVAYGLFAWGCSSGGVRLGGYR